MLHAQNFIRIQFFFFKSKLTFFQQNKSQGDVSIDTYKIEIFKWDKEATSSEVRYRILVPVWADQQLPRKRLPTRSTYTACDALIL